MLSSWCAVLLNKTVQRRTDGRRKGSSALKKKDKMDESVWRWVQWHFEREEAERQKVDVGLTCD